MHALLLALQMCDRVNAFGFSLKASSAVVPGTRSVNGLPQRYYGSAADVGTPGQWRNSAWQFEASVLQMLALSQVVNVCNSVA